MKDIKTRTQLLKSVNTLSINIKKIIAENIIYIINICMLIPTIIATILMTCLFFIVYETEKADVLVNRNQATQIQMQNSMDCKSYTTETSNLNDVLADRYLKRYYEPLFKAENEKKVEIPKPKYEANKKETEIVVQKEESKQKPNAYTIKGIKGICQLPELPTGCEATALTVIMNYKGINVDKYEIAMEYMPRMNLYYENGILYGPNPMHVFTGTPSSDSGLGCFVPCICTTARKFFNANEQIKPNFRVLDLSGKDFKTLLVEYVAQDNPVLVIVTQGLSKQYEGVKWQIYHGKEWQWMTNHHAMVVFGFDISKNKIYVCDPLRENGRYTYNLDEFEEIYNSRGKPAMTIVERTAWVFNYLLIGDFRRSYILPPKIF